MIVKIFLRAQWHPCTGCQPHHASCPIQASLFTVCSLSYELTNRRRFFPFFDNVSAIRYILFSHVMAAIMVFQNNETAAMLVSESNLVGVEFFPFLHFFLVH